MACNDAGLLSFKRASSSDASMNHMVGGGINK